MNDKTSPFSAEIAGALTPELEGAAHSRAHPCRMPRPGAAQAKPEAEIKKGPSSGAKRGE